MYIYTINSFATSFVKIESTYENYETEPLSFLLDGGKKHVSNCQFCRARELDSEGIFEAIFYREISKILQKRLELFFKEEYLKRENEPLPVFYVSSSLFSKDVQTRIHLQRSLGAPVFYVRELLATWVIAASIAREKRR